MINLLQAIRKQLKLDPAGHIDEDWACLDCSYNVRGLLPEGLCPECATLIGRSKYGDALRFCDPSWIKTLTGGINWLIVGIYYAILEFLLIWIGLTVFKITNEHIAVVTVLYVVTIALWLIILIGYWKIATPEPSKFNQEQKLTVRKLVRIICVTRFVLGLFELFVEQADLETVWLLLSSVDKVLLIVGAVALFTYGRRLAIRIPDRRLAKHIYIIMWCVVMASVFWVLFECLVTLRVEYAGPNPSQIIGVWMAGIIVTLIIILWSLRLLYKYRKHFREAANL
jgi:hypothetical protein